METAVDKLEAMFQKTEADMEYIEKRLRLDFLTSASENGTVEENPVKLLENLSAVKARHAALCAQVQEIEAEQKQSMDSIRAHLCTTLQLVQHLQQTAGQEAPQLTEAEQLSTEFLGLTVKGDSAEVKGTLLAWGLYDKSRLGVNKVPVSTEVQAQEQPQSLSEFEEISEAALDGVPRSVRSNVKLAGLNTFYKQLQEHFSNRTNSGPLSLQKMKQLNMKVSEAKLKILEHLGLINLDKKGHVRLL